MTLILKDPITNDTSIRSQRQSWDEQGKVAYYDYMENK